MFTMLSVLPLSLSCFSLLFGARAGSFAAIAGTGTAFPVLAGNRILDFVVLCSRICWAQTSNGLRFHRCWRNEPGYSRTGMVMRRRDDKRLRKPLERV
jgi:hypothetical protein